MTFDGPAFVRHVAERLIHEFAFSQGAGTPSLIGAAKEHPARLQLQRLMPGNVSIGSGIVVDSFGAVSRQQDIVIYEDICPVFAHNDTPEATYFPIEGVIAVGEVKSGLGKKELADAAAKSASVKALRRRAEATQDYIGPPSVSYRNYGNSTCFASTIENQFDQDAKSLDQIFSFVLCQRFTSSPNSTLENFGHEVRALGAAYVPNLVVSLGDGSIGPFNSESGSMTRAVMEGDSVIFSADPMDAFARLISLLRLYSISGRTVDRKHLERYFGSILSSDALIPINARVSLQ